MKHRKKHIWASIMILLIVAFDQVTKRLAESALMGGKIVTLLPGAVQLRYARNTGMAFSLFSGARWVFVALTALVCAGVLFYMFRNKCRSLWGYWSLGVLVAGVMLLVSLLLGLLGFWLFAVPVLWNNYKARQRRNQWKNQWK